MRLGDVSRGSDVANFADKGSPKGFESAIAHVQTQATAALAARRDGPPIPPPNTDASAVAKWWATLTPDQRERLIQEDHAELGTLRGLPAGDIDRINRLRVDEDIGNLNGELNNVNATISEQRANGGDVDPELLARQDRLQTQLGNAEKIKDQMDRLDKAHEKGGPQAYLLTYYYQNDGRFAVALGNPDTADNTAVVVPGSGHDVAHERGPFPTVGEGDLLYDQMNKQSPTADNSVIVWLGTDMPDQGFPSGDDLNPGGSGLNPTYGDAAHGAGLLRDDIAGYQAASAEASGERNHMTIVAHSYGSFMTGEAIKMGMRVDDFVSIGSPGILAENAGALGMANENVFAGAADGDKVANPPLMGSVPLPLGYRPTDDDFGATVFATTDSSGHSEYFKVYDDGRASQSLKNMALIAIGDGDKVARRPPD